MKDTVKNWLILALIASTTVCAYWGLEQSQQLKAIVATDRERISSRLRDIAPSGNLSNTTIEQKPAASKSSAVEVEKKSNEKKLLAQKRRAAAKRARNSPEYKRLQAITKLGLLETGYAALANKLGLTSAERKQFYAFLQEKRATRSDVYAVARSQGLSRSENRATIQRLIEQQNAEIDQAMRQTMGSKVADAYQYFEETRQPRHLAKLLDEKLVNSPNPLTNSQREQIADIIHRTHSQKPAETVNYSLDTYASQLALETGITNPRILNDAGLAESRGILTPGQYEALQSVADQFNARLKIRDLVRAEIRIVTNDK